MELPKPWGMGEEGSRGLMINNIVRRANKLCWFVMKCREAEKIEALIDEYNADREVSPEDKVEDLFIPALVIRRRIADEDTKSKEMRSTLRHFVFLYTRPSAFDQHDNHIATRYWNAGKTHLSFYTDGKGEAITVRPDMMSVFINGCLEYLERFEIHTKDTEIKDGIEVTVRHGAFRDYEAEVYNVHYKADGIRFSIAIKFFANDRYIHIHNLSPDDVQLADRDMPVFSDDFIDRIQTSILAILRRRAYKKETAETHEADTQQLRQLYYLHHAIIDDACRAAQFDALMSMCASLNGNSQEKRKYNRIIKQRLKELRSQENNQDHLIATAYLLTALYISTKDAQYRTELKPIVMQQLPEHKALRGFLSLIRI